MVIVRDLVVEDEESFFFVIDPNQADPALMVTPQDFSVISIVDEEGGIIIYICVV